MGPQGDGRLLSVGDGGWERGHEQDEKQRPWVHFLRHLRDFGVTPRQRYAESRLR